LINPPHEFFSLIFLIFPKYFLTEYTTPFADRVLFRRHIHICLLIKGKIIVKKLFVFVEQGVRDENAEPDGEMKERKTTPYRRSILTPPIRAC